MHMRTNVHTHTQIHTKNNPHKLPLIFLQWGRVLWLMKSFLAEVQNNSAGDKRFSHTNTQTHTHLFGLLVLVWCARCKNLIFQFVQIALTVKLRRSGGKTPLCVFSLSLELSAPTHPSSCVFCSIHQHPDTFFFLSYKIEKWLYNYH